MWSVGNGSWPAGSPCWSNAYTDMLTIESSRKSPGEGSTGPGITGQGAQANSHNLRYSQEAPSQGKAIPNSTEGSYFSSYCRKLPLQSLKGHIHPHSLTPYYQGFLWTCALVARPRPPGQHSPQHMCSRAPCGVAETPAVPPHPLHSLEEWRWDSDREI